MDVIYKYFIEKRYDEEVHRYYYYVTLPKDAEIISTLDVSVDPDLEGLIYAIVDPKETRTIERKIVFYGTGWPISDNDRLAMLHGKFLGTFRDLNNCVWHLWLEEEKTDLIEIFDKLLC